MRTAAEYQSNINELRDELDAIAAVAEAEDRELNDEESKRVDEITDKLIPEAARRAKSQNKIEKEREKRAFNRLSEELNDKQTADGSLDTSANLQVGRFSRGRIPKSQLNHGTLRAFSGENAREDAYVSGMFALAVMRQTPAAVTFCQNHGLIQGAMFTGDNSKGGFIVPDEMNNTIVRLREQRGVFPQYANRIPMGSDIVQIPRLLGDVTAYWVGESNGQANSGVITDSDATLGNAELMARKLGALTKVSSELDEDAVIDVGDTIVQSMAYAMADKVDAAAFNGDATSAYGGVKGLKNALHANAVKVAATTHTSALTFDLADFEAVIGMFPQYTGANPVWFMHSAVYYAACARLMDAAGGNNNITLSQGIPRPMFLGYPVVFTQVMPSTTTTSINTILAYFGDLRLGAAYGTRRSFRTQILTEKYADQDLIGIKTTERLGILIHEDGSTINNRPMVALQTAAS